VAPPVDHRSSVVTVFIDSIIPLRCEQQTAHGANSTPQQRAIRGPSSITLAFARLRDFPTEALVRANRWPSENRTVPPTPPALSYLRRRESSLALAQLDDVASHPQLEEREDRVATEDRWRIGDEMNLRQDDVVQADASEDGIAPHQSHSTIEPAIPAVRLR